MSGQNDQSKSTVGQEILSALGSFVQKLETIDSVDDLPKISTVRRVKLDLRPRPFSGEELKQIRTTVLGVSQAIFAEFVGVPRSAVQEWEQGKSEISGPVCRLLAEIVQSPEGWAAHIKALAKVNRTSA